MSEKELEQKVSDALKLLELCQKQVAELNMNCREATKVCKKMEAEMEGRHSLQVDELEKKKQEIMDLNMEVNKRLDKDKREYLDKGHERSQARESEHAYLKACMLNLYEFLPAVRSEAPSEHEKKILKEQLHNLGK